MRRITPILFVLLWLATAVVWASGNPSANGGGIYYNSNITFGFTAVQHRDGTVRGNLVWHDRYDGVIYHVRIDCLSFNAAGDVAYMSGTLVDTNYLPYLGRTIAFSVSNNPNRISQVLALPSGSPDNCTNVKPPPVFPLEGGSINIRP